MRRCSPKVTKTHTHTLSTYPLTRPINIPVNTPYQDTISNHPINTLYQHTHQRVLLTKNHPYQHCFPSSDVNAIVIMVAKEGKDDKTLQCLRALPSCVHAKDEFGYTALHWASFEGHVDTTDCLLTQGKVSYQHNLSTKPHKSMCSSTRPL